MHDHHCPAKCPRKLGYGGEGRGCACSDRATNEAFGLGWWLVIGTSLVVIVVQVSSAIAGYLPKFHF